MNSTTQTAPAVTGNRVWFDTEFIEDGKTIELISIGMVREDGATYYAEVAGVDYTRANPWVIENVIPHLQGEQFRKSKETIAQEIVAFVGSNPEFWAYYADYDWVVLCQLYGRMVDLPKGWPMHCLDLKQLAGKKKLAPKTSIIHHALSDALWTRYAFAVAAADESIDDGRPCTMDEFMAALFEEEVADAYDIRDAAYGWVHGDWKAALEYLDKIPEHWRAIK